MMHGNCDSPYNVQVQGSEGFPVKYSNVFQCAYSVVKEEGVAAFWRGSMCSFMKVFVNIISHTCYSIDALTYPFAVCWSIDLASSSSFMLAL